MRLPIVGIGIGILAVLLATGIVKTPLWLKIYWTLLKGIMKMDKLVIKSSWAIIKKQIGFDLKK